MITLFESGLNQRKGWHLKPKKTVQTNGFRATGTYPVNRNVFQDHEFTDEDQPKVEETSNDERARDIITTTTNIMRPLKDNSDNCLPEPRNIVTPDPQSVNEPSTQSIDGHHQENTHIEVPMSTMDDSIAGPSTSYNTFLSPKVLQPVQRLKKTVSNRGRKGTRPTILTSSPYEKDLETSIQRITKKKPKKTLKKTVQKKRRKISRDKTTPSESSDKSNYSVNDSTDESPDRSQNQNGKCLYCNGFFSEDVHGEKWIQCVSCRQWGHEECTGIEDMVDFYVCELCTND